MATMQVLDNKLDDVCLDSLLDAAYLELDNFFETDSGVKQPEPQQVLVKLHESFQTVQTSIRANAGCREELILQALGELIRHAARAAVVFERGRCGRADD